MNKLLGVVTSAAFIAFSGIASAATISLGAAGTLSCFLAGTMIHADCRGIVSGPPTVYSMSEATLYNIGANSEANEAAFLNGLLSPMGGFVKDDVDKTEKGGVPAADYDVTSEFFALKLGAGHAYLRNFSGQALSISYMQNPAQGGGLSHESQIGQLLAPPPPPPPPPTPNPVPLPASLPLLLAGLGILAWRRRR